MNRTHQIRRQFRRSRPEPRKLRLPEPDTRPADSLSDLLAPAQTLAHQDAAYRDRLAGLAMDAAPSALTGLCDAGFVSQLGGRSFIGYPVCAELSQVGLMQAGVNTVADEMARRFARFHGGQDLSDDVTRLNDALDRLQVSDHFRTMAEYCGYFGGGLLYLDFGQDADLDKPIALTDAYIGLGGLKRLVPVEPLSVAPLAYNAADPLAPDYYRPSCWYVTGRGPVHASRFLRFVKTEPPLILRPAYNFFGIPDVQLALDYLTHFNETRESAARLLTKFSLTILKTDVDALLYGADASGVQRRIRHLARDRDNDGVYAISHEDEDVVQLNTPLSGVTDVVRQALELLACIWRIPVIKYLGVSPSGMNATGESDLRSFYDHVGGQRKKLFRRPLESLLTILSLSELGRVPDGVQIQWPSLWEMTERERAEVGKLKADTDAVYLDRSVIDQEEVRASLAADEDGRYVGLDPDAVPQPPNTEQDADTPAAGLAALLGGAGGQPGAEA
ncbi:MAG: DUF1073 domain-containing protein [Rhodospirillaceae bacterium]|nr:DUF1073 domain-containing protein [Rhodospirillaceae bacterium]